MATFHNRNPYVNDDFFGMMENSQIKKTDEQAKK